MYRIIEL